MDQSNAVKKKSRRAFTKAIAAGLIALPISAISRGGTTQDRRGKKRQTKQGPRFKQTSPITIGGGGSVSIDFKHQDYRGGAGKYSKANDEIETIWVYTAGLSKKWDLADFVFRKDCSITVHTKRGSNAKEIIVRSKPGARATLSIEFDEGEFKPDSANTDYHYNKDREIDGLIEIVDNKDHSIVAFSLPPKGHFVVVNYMGPS